MAAAAADPSAEPLRVAPEEAPREKGQRADRRGKESDMETWVWVVIAIAAVLFLMLLFRSRGRTGGRRVIVKRGGPRRRRWV
jgi:type VI protein secretion system component VasF